MRTEEYAAKKNPALIPLGEQGRGVGLLSQEFNEVFNLQEYLKQNVQTAQHGQEHAHAPIFVALCFRKRHIQFFSFWGAAFQKITGYSPQRF